MSPLDRPDDLKSYYQDRGVVDAYMHKRTAQPLNGLLHDRQITFLNEVMAARGVRTALEIACGPGRLTAEMRAVPFGVAIDASQPMLETAQQRMGGQAGVWSFLRTDAFRLPFQDASFDVVYTCRFIRHFQAEDRVRLYREIQRVLRPHGALLVDALNRDVSQAERERQGVDTYKIFDVLYSPEELRQEMIQNGFEVQRMDGILRHFPLQRRINRLRFRLGGLARLLIHALEAIPGKDVNTWMLVCEKRG